MKEKLALYKNCVKKRIIQKFSEILENFQVVVENLAENWAKGLLRSYKKEEPMCNEATIAPERQESVSDKAAAQNVKRFLKELKGSGRKSVNVLDLLMEFKYSPEQIERVMSSLEKEGVVKEDWPPW